MAKEKRIFLMRPNVGQNELELLREVIESKYLVEGPMTQEFEQLVAEYVGAKYAIACTSATTGLEMCLRAIGIGPGDEVIIPDFTHPATGLCVMAVGASPVIVDVDLKTYNTNASYISAAISERTKAAMPVSWGGQPLEIDAINELARQHDFYVIDDAACSLGTSLNGKRTGNTTDFAVFSFHPRKIFTTGDGGCITTNNDEWAEFLNSYKRFGVMKVDGKARFVRYGTNLRFSNILAAVAVGQLRRTDQIINGRIERAHIYNNLLNDVSGVRIPYVLEGARHNYQSYCIFIEESGKRDILLKEMRVQNIEVQIGTYAIHREPVFCDAKIVGDLKNSSSLADSLLTLPLHHEISEEDQIRVVITLKGLL